jgi:hypothetical protein
MSRQPRQMRFLRLAGLAAVVAACLIGFGTYRLTASGCGAGGETGAEPVPISVFVGLAAIVGSALNQPFRRDDGIPDHAYPVLYFLWKCSVAVAFAFVLYLVFMGGILSGELFPAFQNTTEPFVSIGQFVGCVNPDTNADFAKLLLWAFVAGFSEKFVPNLIARLEGQASGPADGEAEETP